MDGRNIIPSFPGIPVPTLRRFPGHPQKRSQRVCRAVICAVITAMACLQNGRVGQNDGAPLSDCT